MSKAGCPYDNAPMERFYNTFKSNFYNITSFSNVEMMDELTMKYINWYNYVCPHSYNNYLTPMEARYRQIFIEQSVTKKLDHNIAKMDKLFCIKRDAEIVRKFNGNNYAQLAKQYGLSERAIRTIIADYINEMYGSVQTSLWQ